jgi:7-carboxy-7-deazaguanine synthase
MRISEIFYSLQGEGSLVGMPSAFIRTTGCNLRCAWCDTPYTSWEPEGQDMLMGSIIATVRRLNWPRYVVVTGGEPMIQDEIEMLCDALREQGMHITIETAGTVFKKVACDLMSISPKLSNSVPRRREGGKWAAQHDRLRYQPDVLKQLMAEYPYQLKFVVKEPDDVQEIAEMITDLGADPDRVLLMPEGTDQEKIFERSQWIAEVCKDRKWRYTPRLHIDIWGNKRGT